MEIYNQAAAAQKAGDLAEAERLYRQILSRASPRSAGESGQCAGARRAAAARRWRTMTGRWRRGPISARRLFNRGNVLLELSRPKTRWQAMTRRWRCARFAGVWNNRGTALRSMRRLDEALASFERAVGAGRRATPMP